MLRRQQSCCQPWSNLRRLCSRADSGKEVLVRQDVQTARRWQQVQMASQTRRRVGVWRVRRRAGAQRRQNMLREERGAARVMEAGADGLHQSWLTHVR
jgi:hypothetical protein